MAVKNEYRDAIGVIKSAFRKKMFYDAPQSSEDRIYTAEMLAKHGILATCFRNAFDKGRDKDLFGAQEADKIYSATCATAIAGCSMRADLVRVLREANNRNIKLVLFKGAVIADTYPDWQTRISSDADIFVYHKDAGNAVRMLNELGYVIDEENSKKQVPVYVHHERNHVIELHFSLWEDYEGEQIELLENLNICDEATLNEYEVSGVKTYSLGATQHLIFQMFHVIKHFVVQGIGIKYLVDIRYFYDRYKSDIDMDSFWDAMKLLNYEDFCKYYFGLAIILFGADKALLSKYEWNELKKDKGYRKQCYKLFVDLWEYVNKESHDYSVITLMSPYLEGRAGDTADNSGSSFARKLQLIFPAADSLQDDFAYAKKCHALLPVAWVHKWSRFAVNRITGKSSSGMKKLAEADKRIEMMKEMKLNG